MKSHSYRALSSCLFMTLAANASAEVQKDETLVVAASRTNHSITDMAQTTWVVEQAEIEQQVQGVRS